jgi:hypothetical protein
MHRLAEPFEEHERNQAPTERSQGAPHLFDAHGAQHEHEEKQPENKQGGVDPFSVHRDWLLDGDDVFRAWAVKTKRAELLNVATSFIWTNLELRRRLAAMSNTSNPFLAMRLPRDDGGRRTRTMELRNLLFKLPQAEHQLGQFLYRDPLPFGLFIRHGRDAQHGFFGGDIAHDAGFGANHGLRAELQVAGDA